MLAVSRPTQRRAIDCVISVQLAAVIVRLVAQRHLADGPQYEVHQGRSLRSGLAQSLEDQHSSVDLVITVDHASRAPVCGVGLGRLAGVLGESVWPQPFARLAG